ncbi:MAG: Mu-like prophage major head subunit gpT family protein [Clostridiaceae bacterium]|nr:Mu-like prophage major head subunit gpT family protein [Clostridiaceae bacterium]
MIVNQATLQQIFIGFKTVFQKAFQSTEPSYKKIATVIPSSTRSEEYKWLGKVPRMREWVGDRVIQNLAAYDYTIKNKDFELTIAVDKNDIEDDTIGIYNPLFQEMGHAAAMHPDELVFGLLAKGFEAKAYDGKNFFDTGHKEGKAPSQSNKGVHKLTPETYGAARASMMSFKDEHGKPLKIKPSLLVVPPQLEGMARRILLAETINNETNIYKGSAEIHVEPELSENPNAWYLLDTTKSIKPLIFQQRKKPVFVAKDNVKDDNVFFQKEFIYGIDSRDNAGFALWQLAFGSTGETEASGN